MITILILLWAVVGIVLGVKIYDATRPIPPAGEHTADEAAYQPQPDRLFNALRHAQCGEISE